MADPTNGTNGNGEHHENGNGTGNGNGNGKHPPRPKIPHDIKFIIVRELACFTPVAVVRAMVEEETGVRYNISTILYYDATTASTKLHEKWRELFAETRKQFISDNSRTAIAHRSVRLRRLQRLVDRVEEKLDDEHAKKNPMVFDMLVARAQQLDEQAAKEVGDAYTNKRRIINGDPEDELAEGLGITREELRTALSDLEKSGHG